MKRAFLMLSVVFMCFLAASAVPAFAWVSNAGSSTVETEQDSYCGSVYEGASPFDLGINVTEIMDLINSVLPLLLTLAIVGALFGAIGKMTRKF